MSLSSLHRMVYPLGATFRKVSSSTVESKLQKSNSSTREWVVSLGSSPDGSSYTIKLNNIDVKTPMNNTLVIRDETLALATANEWKSQSAKKKLDLKNMHLTTLAYDAIDNPFKETKNDLIASIIDYLKFDTVRFREIDHEELLTKQSRHWDPLIGWFEHRFECFLPIEYGNIMNTGSIPDSTQLILERHLQSHDRWPLVGVRCMTRNMKSYVLAACLADRFLKVDMAVDLARLETNFQTERWSKVEWEHDLDEQVTRARVAAGALFYHLSI